MVNLYVCDPPLTYPERCLPFLPSYPISPFKEQPNILELQALFDKWQTKEKKPMNELKFGTVLFDPDRPDILFVYNGQEFLEIHKEVNNGNPDRLPNVSKKGKKE